MYVVSLIYMYYRLIHRYSLLDRYSLIYYIWIFACLPRLHPSLQKKGAPWSERETAALIRLQHKWGNSWAKITQKMTNCGRSHNDVKNKWNSLMRNQQFLSAYNARQKEEEEEMTKKSEGGHDKAKASGKSKDNIATFAATMARKLCARSNYNRNDEDEELAATSEESDAASDESEDEANPDDNVVEVQKQKKAKTTKKIKESKTKKENKANVTKKEDGDCKMTEDGSGHLLTDVEQSESQLEFGRRLQQYKWAVEQEKKIEQFRRGRLDSGLTCRDVDALKLMGLGLGIDALKKKYFGSAENP